MVKSGWRRSDRKEQEEKGEEGRKRGEVKEEKGKQNERKEMMIRINDEGSIEGKRLHNGGKYRWDMY